MFKKNYLKLNNVYLKIKKGNCFTFNPTIEKEKMMRIYQAGKMNGLQLELFVGKNDNFNSLSYTKGAKIFVYNHSSVYSDADSIDVSTAQDTNINLRKKIINKLKKPYSDCEINLDEINSSSSELVQIFNRLNYTYRQNDCLNICYQKLLVQNCNCFDFAVSGINYFNTEVKSCSASEISCIESIFQHQTDNYYDTCRKYCPKECNSIEYLFDVSFSEYPTDVRLRRIVVDNPYLKGYQELKNKLLKVNIYFNKLSYEIINESPAVSIPSLLSNVGGTMGLFMGFSVLSFCEICELFSALTYVSVDMIIEYFVFRMKSNNSREPQFSPNINANPTKNVA